MNLLLAISLSFWCAIGFAFPAAVYANEAGAKLFKKQCKICHTIEHGGAVRQGPNLWGVAGRAAGSVAGFKYSNAFKASDIVWTRQALDAWLTDPKAMIPGTIMTYKQKDAETRRLVIDFLTTAKD